MIRYYKSGAAIFINNVITLTSWGLVFDRMCPVYEFTSVSGTTLVYSAVSDATADSLFDPDLMYKFIYPASTTISFAGSTTGTTRTKAMTTENITIGGYTASRYVMRGRFLSWPSVLSTSADQYRIVRHAWHFNDLQPALYQTGIIRHYYDVSHDNMFDKKDGKSISEFRYMRCQDKISRGASGIAAATKDTELEFVGYDNTNPIGAYTTVIIITNIGQDGGHASLSTTLNFEWTFDLANSGLDMVPRAGDQAAAAQLVQFHNLSSNPATATETFSQSVARVIKGAYVSPVVRTIANGFKPVLPYVVRAASEYLLPGSSKTIARITDAMTGVKQKKTAVAITNGRQAQKKKSKK